MRYRFFVGVIFLLFLAATILTCSARGTSGVSGTTGMTGTSGGTTGTGTAAPTTLGSGTPSSPGTSDRIRPRIADKRDDDLWITKEIVRKLNEGNLSEVLSIDVESNDRVVTLEGLVANPDEAERVIALARSVPTVKDVISKLQIKQ